LSVTVAPHDPYETAVIGKLALDPAPPEALTVVVAPSFTLVHPLANTIVSGPL
jgi:hypothetical protein